MSLVLAAPELTLHQSVKYVAGAYVVVLAVVLIYVVIMSIRLQHNARELEALRREVIAAEESPPVQEPEPETAASR